MGKGAPEFNVLCQLCTLALEKQKVPISIHAGFAQQGLALSERHCVVPLLAAGLAMADTDARWSTDMAELLRRKVLSGLQQMVRMETELGAIASGLSAAGVDFLLLKGAAMARQAYPAPELRGYDDLDLWVRSADLKATVNAFLKMGYRLWRPMDARASTCAARAGIEVALVHPERKRLVEVAHGEAALAPTRQAAREMLEGAVSIDVAGTPVQAPCPVHALLFACQHGAHHCWDRLGWVADVAGLWVRLSPAERENACAVSQRWKIENMLGLGLRLAVEFLGLSLDGRAAEWAARPTVGALARRVGLDEIRHDSPRAAALDRLRFERDAQDSAWRRLRMLASWIFTPTLGDIEAVPLSPALYPLYAVVRPLRLLRHPWLRDWRKWMGHGRD